MKEVVFKKLTGKNFLSIGNVPIEFTFPSGINIITGHNFDKNDENGVGKTTIVQLFFWVLFGDTLAQLKNDQVVNDINKKGCYGRLEFDVTKNGKKKSYVIERGIKPSFCKLAIDGEEDKTLSTIDAVNQNIQKIISSTPTIFKNCIVLSMNNSTPFMAQTKTQRKAFVESMFRLEVLRVMEKTARNKWNELSRSQDINLETLKGLEGNKESFKQQKEAFDKSKEEKIETLKNRKSEYSKEIEKLKSDLEIIDENEYDGVKKTLAEKTKEKESTAETLSLNKAELSVIDKQITSKESELAEKDITLSKLKVDIKSKVTDIKFESGLTLDDKDKILSDLIASIPDDISNKKSEIHKLGLENSEHNKTIDKIKNYGSVCSFCRRPFSEEEQSNTDTQIKELQDTVEKNNTEKEELTAGILSLESKLKQANLLKEFILAFKEKSKLTDDIKSLKSERESVSEKLTPLISKIQNIIVEIESLTDKKEKIDSTITTNKTIQSQIDNLKKFLVTVDSDIEKVKLEKNTFEILIEENEEKLTACQEVISETRKNLQIYDNIKFIVSEDGIKSYIIKKLITVLNDRIKYYLNLLESNAKLTFDEFFDDTLFNDKNLEKAYENFSGGERKRIDLSCLFSFLDIRRIQGDVRFNVIFFDELLDSAISSKACEFVFQILKERYDLYNENSYIITHRKEFKSDSKDLINNTIHLEKRNGFTKIGDINGIAV